METFTPIILAGGRGTRLQKAWPDRPKVLAPVGGRPFICYLLDQLDALGFQDAILCTGYKANCVQATLGKQYNNLALRYSREEKPLGTGGALLAALPHVATKHVLVLNGDSYTDANLEAYLQWYRQGAYRAALYLVWVAAAARYGSVAVEADSRISAFREKDLRDRSGWINAGLYVFDHALLATFAHQGNVSLEKDLLPSLISAGLYGYPGRNRFIDIGTPESYAAAAGFFRDVQGKADQP